MVMAGQCAQSCNLMDSAGPSLFSLRNSSVNGVSLRTNTMKNGVISAKAEIHPSG